MGTYSYSSAFSSKSNILVVDDDESIRIMLGMLLSDDGYSVSVVGNADAAATLLEQVAFDVAIIDRVLSEGEDGLSVIRRLKQRQPYCEVILVTGYPTYQSAVESIDLQVTAYLEKPVRISVLRDVVGRAVVKGTLPQKSAPLNA